MARRSRYRVGASFWAVPAACGTVAVIGAWGTARLDRAVGDRATSFLFPGPPEGARSFLGAVITAMISFTGLVFSITIVVLVLASGQFSPRVLRQFLRDRVIGWSLGVFVATFLFAMTTLRSVLGTNGAGAFVPRVSLTVSFVLVLAAVAQFVYYVHHVVQMVQVKSIIASIAAETRQVLERRYPPEPARAGPPALRAGPVVAVPAPGPGAVVGVDHAALVDLAHRAGLVVVVAVRVGDFRPAGAALLHLHGAAATDADTAPYARAVTLETERTMEQDLAFGFRQLVDIADRALSPSVNDPTTACQVLDVLHDLLRALVTRRVEPERHADPDGVTRVECPSYQVADLVDLAVTEPWFYGRDNTQVPARLVAMLDDLRSAARPEHRAALQRWREVVDAASPAAG